MKKSFNKEELTIMSFYNCDDRIKLINQLESVVEKDREDYKNSFKSKLMSRDGVKENDANVKANNLFRAMDRFNELKS